jgi:hypothetical protein
MLPLLNKERVGVRFKELFTLIEMLPWEDEGDKGTRR